MTVRAFIQKLLEECDNLDGLIDFYASASYETVKEMAKEEGCVDHFLDIEEIEDMGGYYHVHLEKITL